MRAALNLTPLQLRDKFLSPLNIAMLTFTNNRQVTSDAKNDNFSPVDSSRKPVHLSRFFWQILYPMITQRVMCTKKKRLGTSQKLLNIWLNNIPLPRFTGGIDIYNVWFLWCFFCHPVWDDLKL